MEEITQILQNNTNQMEESSKTKVKCLWANNKEDLEKYSDYNGIIDFPEPTVCEFCGKTNYSKGMVVLNFVHWNKPICDCEESIKRREEKKAKKEKEEQEKLEQEQKLRQKMKIEKLFNNSKLGARFKQRTFKNFEVNSNNIKAYNISKAFVENFDKAKEQGLGLIFTGNYGTGKTHLACSIAIELLNKGIPVIYGTLITLLGKIKETYNDNYNLNETDVLDIYSTVDLLIIDDLGKERPSEWVLEKLYYIINQRYENLKPTIVTSNFNIDNDLIKRISTGDNISTAEAIVSRLNEMCTGIVITGKDYRLN